MNKSRRLVAVACAVVLIALALHSTAAAAGVRIKVFWFPWVPVPLKPAYRHWIRWHSYDGVNAPKSHAVVGPVFFERGGIEEEAALRDFEELYLPKLKELPPCDPEQVKLELSLRKLRKSPPPKPSMT